jgi:hypothetical protein
MYTAQPSFLLQEIAMIVFLPNGLMAYSDHEINPLNYFCDRCGLGLAQIHITKDWVCKGPPVDRPIEDKTDEWSKPDGH